jgi:pre-mRNA-processing factor 6
MGALARDNGEIKDESGMDDGQSAFMGFRENSGMYADSMQTSDPYDQDDDEADQIYAGVDEAMAGRHKRKGNGGNGGESTRDTKKPKISEQFVDLKQNLGSLKASDWDAIPEVGDSSLKYTQQRRFQNVYVPLPDNIISGTASKLSGGDNFATQDLADVAGARGGGGGVDSSAAISKGRTDGLISTLDTVSDSVSGQTVVDPRGYMTNLDNLANTGMSEVNDIKKARMLLSSVTSSNPKHAPGWVAAARIEEVAGKMKTARKIIQQGCERCPNSEDLWLENARLNSGDDRKAVLAEAVQHLPASVNIWKKASSLEESIDKKRIVLRKALEFVPDSVELWKGAIELEPSPDDARVMLERAVECVPQCVDMWLALSKLETYENARKVLNQAREALPHERIVWITAASLEEAHRNDQLINKIISKMVSFLTQDKVIIDRQEWIRDAQRAEASQSPLVCDAIIRHTIGTGVDEEDRLVTWMDDAESCLSVKSFDNDNEWVAFKHTARAIYNHALSFFPAKQALWLGLSSLEKQHGSPESLGAVLENAVQKCPGAELLWLMAAKEKWTSMNDVPAARRILQDAIRHNSDSEELWLAAGKLEWETDNFDEARKVYQNGRKTLSSRPRLWMKAALLELEQNKRSEALSLVKQAMETFPSFYKFYLLAAECCPATQVKEASEYLKVGVAACTPPHVGNDTLSIRLARLEEKENGANKARSILELARMRLPKSPELWLESIRLEYRQDNDTLRETLIAKAKQECGNAAGLIWAEDLLTCAKPAFKSRSVDALKKCDNDPHVVLAIAHVFARDAKFEKARKWFQRSCEIQPKLGDAWCGYYAFEVQQEALKRKNNAKAGKVDDTIEVLASIEKGCVDADPNRGELWNSFRKQTSHRRLPVGKVLKGIVEDILSGK